MSVQNLINVYTKSKPWEIELGSTYYPRLFTRLMDIGRGRAINPSRVVAAFCALSSNTDEANNLTALETCLDIVAGKLPEGLRCAGYPLNQRKALAILRGEPIDSHLKGRKVVSFYHNVLSYQDPKYITVDGHMHAAWQGRRMTMYEAAVTSSTRYNEVADDIREAANYVSRFGYSALRFYGMLYPSQFQAVIWLTWKRIHNILYSPQLKLDLGPARSLLYRTSYPRSDGRFKLKGISPIPAERQILLFDVENSPTD